MSKVIDSLRKKAIDIVSNRKALANNVEGLFFDEKSVKGASLELSDDEILSVFKEYDSVIQSETARINNDIIKTDKYRDDTLEEVENRTEELESTLEKIEKIKEISDIEVEKSAIDGTKRKIGELNEIRSLLNEECISFQIDNNRYESGTASVVEILNKTIDDTIPLLSTGPKDENNRIIYREAERWQDRLGNDEYCAMQDYTCQNPAYHININNVLRGKENHFDEGNEQRAYLIHKALEKASIPCECTVYRSAPLEALGKFADASDEELVGLELSDRGFMSTSLIYGDQGGGPVQLEIRVPVGAKGVYLKEGIAPKGEGETEVLFDKGVRLIITGVRYDFKRRILLAEMLQ